MSYSDIATSCDCDDCGSLECKYRYYYQDCRITTIIKAYNNLLDYIEYAEYVDEYNEQLKKELRAMPITPLECTVTRKANSI